MACLCCAESWAQLKGLRGSFVPRWDVPWPWSVIFRRLSHLEDSLWSYLVHCFTWCQRLLHSICLHDIQTLQQQGAQIVKQIVPCPRVMHSYISLFPWVHSYWLSPQHLCHCWRPQEISHDSPVCAVPQPGDSLQIPYSLCLCYIYTSYGILIKRSQAFYPYAVI